MHKYIYGAGGHGKVVLDAMHNAQMECDGFVDDRQLFVWAGHQVLSLSNLPPNKNFSLHLSIGNNKSREKIVSDLIGVDYFSVFHPTTVVATSAIVEVGSFLAAHSIVGPDAYVGKHCIINHAAIVDHDCSVNDYTHIAPRSCLGGGVKVGKGVLVGAGAIILPGIVVEDYAVIGAGAVVVENVKAKSTVVGVPARILR